MPRPERLARMVHDAGGDEITFTYLDEPLFPDAGGTKRDLIGYLDSVADRILPALRDRPLSVIRVLRGERPFMQKNLPTYTPPWVESVRMWAESSHREVRYALCNDRRTLLWFGNQRAVEYHPALVADPGATSELVLDIDPASGGDFHLAVRAARAVGAALHEVGLTGALKTSGAKGLHVFVPIAGAGAADIAAAARAIAVRAERLEPSIATTSFLKEDRGGKVFIDSTRAPGTTVVAVYSPRTRPGLPVSFPVAWDELDSIHPRDFTIHTAAALVARADIWLEGMPHPQSLPQDLLAEGRAIPVARVQGMHEGRRRARRRLAEGQPPAERGDAAR